MKGKQVKGFERYSVTKDGIVFNNETKKPLTPNKKKTGYYEVCLFDENHQRHYKTIHRIVAEAYCGNPDKKLEVNHIDGDKSNNCANNLEWATRNENLKHAFQTGLKAKDTSARGIVATSIEKGTSIRFSSIYEAAKALGISKGNICLCCQGKRPFANGYEWRYAE